MTRTQEEIVKAIVIMVVSFLCMAAAVHFGWIQR